MMHGCCCLEREVAVSVSAFCNLDARDQIASCEVHHGLAMSSLSHQQLLVVSDASTVDSITLSATHNSETSCMVNSCECLI